MTSPGAGARGAFATAGRPLLLFLALTFAWTWVMWGLLIATGSAPGDGLLALALWVLGGFGPAVAAVFLVLRGRAFERHQLVAGLLHWRLGAWYAVLLLPLGIGLLSALIALVSGAATWDVGELPWAIAMVQVSFVVNSLFTGGNEEIGWRGFALPRLLRVTSPVMASVLLGVVWAVWHAPLWFVADSPHADASPLLFAISAIGLSLILTWVYLETDGSVLLVVLLHGAINAWYWFVLLGLIPDSESGFEQAAAVITVSVAAVIITLRGSRLGAPPGMATPVAAAEGQRPSDTQQRPR